LLDTTKLEKFDSHGMYKIYDKWPEIAKESFESKQNSVNFEDVNHIVFAGMGGSGAMGDMFASIFSKTNIHVSIVKGYLLPNTVDEKSLVIATSISGNTVETLTVLDAARNTNCKIIALSSGGKIEKFCKEHKLDFRKIPQNHSARASFTGFLYSLLKILDGLLPITKKDVDESILELRKLQKLISSSNLSDSNPSLALANGLKGIPLIYYPYGLNAAATRFKNSLQENSKLHAITEDMIETCHNGIVSWERKSDVFPILIEGEDDHIKTKERGLILKEFFQENKIEYKEIHSIGGGNILSKLVTLVYLLDYSTIYKAILDNVDPSPVKSIDFVKERL